MAYILDTNICIYIIKKKPISVFNKLETIPLGQIGISTITVAELEYGARKSVNYEKNISALHLFLTPFEIYDFEYNATVEYGIIRAELDLKGTPIGPMDTLIAAHDKRLNYILVTNNEKEFNRVTALQMKIGPYNFTLFSTRLLIGDNSQIKQRQKTA